MIAARPVSLDPPAPPTKRSPLLMALFVLVIVTLLCVLGAAAFVAHLSANQRNILAASARDISHGDLSFTEGKQTAARGVARAEAHLQEAERLQKLHTQQFAAERAAWAAKHSHP